MTAEALGVATSRHHPKAKRYPKGAFLQPGFFVFDRDGRLAHAWRQRPGLLDGNGAMRRPLPEQMLAEAAAVVDTEVDSASSARAGT